MEPEPELKHLAPEPALLTTLLYVHGGSGRGESAHTDAHHTASDPIPAPVPRFPGADSKQISQHWLSQQGRDEAELSGMRALSEGVLWKVTFSGTSSE